MTIINPDTGKSVEIAQLLERARTLHRSGRLQDALDAYRTVLGLDPKVPEANAGVAILAMHARQIHVAIEHYRRALAVQPQVATHWIGFITAVFAAGQTDKAYEALQQARLRGLSGTEADQLQSKIERKRRAKLLPAQMNPEYHEAMRAANEAEQRGNLELAATAYLEAYHTWPDEPILVERAADLFNALNQFAIADDLYAVLLAKDAKSPLALIGAGIAANGLGNPARARDLYERVLAIDPKNALARALLGAAFDQLGQTALAESAYRQAIKEQPNQPIANSNLLHLLAYSESVTAIQYLKEATQWDARMTIETTHEDTTTRRFIRAEPANRRLAIGYVSGDFRQHAVATFIEPLLTNHDRTKFEIHAFSNTTAEDAVTHRIRTLVDVWHPIALLSDEAMAIEVERTRIDVLIDLSGHTAHHRLQAFARRIAPVQAHYLGYAASTGLREMDYWIADEFLVHDSHLAHFSEKVWRLERCWTAYASRDGAPIPKRNIRKEPNIVFGSFNALRKISDETIRVWSELLHQMPDARLLLKAKDLEVQENRVRIVSAFATRGIPPDRIELRGSTPTWFEHMAAYNDIDIALDPLGSHTGVTTTCDALWMGVPVITLAGNRVAHRWSASLLHALGRKEWVANEATEYIEKAISLAQLPLHLLQIRGVLRGEMQRSAVCDVKALAKALEGAYGAMFEAWWQGNGLKQVPHK